MRGRMGDTRSTPNLQHEKDSLVHWLQAARQSLTDEPDTPAPHTQIVRLTDLVTKLLGGDDGTFILFDDAAMIVYSTNRPQVAGQKVDLELYPEILAAIDAGNPVEIPNVHTDKRLDRVQKQLPPTLGSVIVLPVQAGQATRGVVVVRSTTIGLLPAANRELAWFFVCCAARILRHTTPPLFRNGNLFSDGTEATALTRLSTVESTEHHRILVVEDDTDCREAITCLLADSGYQIESAADGQTALDLATSFHPTLVLLDVRLPDMSGYQVAKKLKAEGQLLHAGVIFLSGVQNLPADLLEAGLDDADFLRKPFDVDDLMARVARGLREVNEQSSLHTLANTDQLTGLGNLRLLEERLGIEASRIARYKTPVTIMVADMDDLKAINDRHGHLTGSKAIRAVGTTIASEIRHTDVAARYGGDEFIVLMPHTTLEEGIKLAERIRSRLRSTRPWGIVLTISIGLASFDARIDQTLEDVIARADAATYRAKEMGRDQICSDQPPDNLVAGPPGPHERRLRFP